DPVLGYAYVSRAAAQGLAAAKETLAQLDGLLPLEARRKGVAIAAANARAAPAPTSKPIKPLKPIQVASKTPAPAPAAASTPVSGGWRIQLGAFSQRGSAEALFQR